MSTTPILVRADPLRELVWLVGGSLGIILVTSMKVTVLSCRYSTVEILRAPVVRTNSELLSSRLWKLYHSLDSTSLFHIWLTYHRFTSTQ